LVGIELYKLGCIPNIFTVLILTQLHQNEKYCCLILVLTTMHRLLPNYAVFKLFVSYTSLLIIKDTKIS